MRGPTALGRINPSNEAEYHVGNFGCRKSRLLPDCSTPLPEFLRKSLQRGDGYLHPMGANHGILSSYVASATNFGGHPSTNVRPSNLSASMKESAHVKCA